MDDERFIVKASSGPRYVVGCRNKLDKAKLKPGTRVSLDMTTLTIMRMLPREVDPNVYHMLHEDAGGVPFSSIGGKCAWSEEGWGPYGEAEQNEFGMFVSLA